MTVYAGYTESREQIARRWQLMKERAARRAQQAQPKPSNAKKEGQPNGKQ